jgi:hypothetical protein
LTFSKKKKKVEKNQKFNIFIIQFDFTESYEKRRGKAMKKGEFVYFRQYDTPFLFFIVLKFNNFLKQNLKKEK